MIVCLGDFVFDAINLKELERSFESGLSKVERINNHAYFVKSKLESESVKISGITLPIKKDKNHYLDTLINMLKTHEAYGLYGCNGIYYGDFVILKINEKQRSFLDGAGYLESEFEIELERAFNDIHSK